MLLKMLYKIRPVWTSQQPVQDCSLCWSSPYQLQSSLLDNVNISGLVPVLVFACRSKKLDWTGLSNTSPHTNFQKSFPNEFRNDQKKSWKSLWKDLQRDFQKGCWSQRNFRWCAYGPPGWEKHPIWPTWGQLNRTEWLRCENGISEAF